MATFVLPWYPFKDFTMEIALNRRLFVVRSRHNPINDRYSMDFFSHGLQHIILGVAVVKGTDLLVHMAKNFHPSGHMFVSGEEPTYDNLLSGSSLVIYDTSI